MPSHLLEQCPHTFITNHMDKLFFEHTPNKYIFINYILVLLCQYAKTKGVTFKKEVKK